MQKLNHVIQGDLTQRPVVFVHGLLSKLASWKQVQKKLSQGSVALDLPGHGASYFAEKYTISELASAVKDLLDHLDIEKPLLVGHSLGAKVVLRFASLYPKRCAGLFIEDNSLLGKSTTVALKNISKIIDKTPVPFSNFKEARAYLGSIKSSNLESLGLQDLDMQFLSTCMHTNKQKGGITWSIDVEGLKSLIWGDLTNLDLTKDWMGFKGPVFLAKGSESPVVSEAEFYNLLKIKQNCQGAVIKGAGHNCHMTHSKEFLHHLESFIRSCD